MRQVARSPRDIKRLPPSPDHAKYRELAEYLASPTVDIKVKDHLFKQTAENDFWFFCRYVTSARYFVCEIEDCDYCGENIFDHPYVFQMCREVQADPDGYLEQRPRGHLKTTVVTIFQTIWDFLHRPRDVVAIVTWELGEVGNGFIDALQQEMQPDRIAGSENADGEPARKNELLVRHWPHIFWADPEKEAPAARKKWKRGSLDLKTHPGIKENSISAMSLNAIRTSRHFHCIIYDDIVVEASSMSPDACEDCTIKFKATGPLAHPTYSTRKRAVGTRWASNDTYRWILDEGVLKRRPSGIEDCYDENGQSVFHPGSKWLDAWRRDLGETLFAANMRNKPIDEQGVHLFRPEWLHRRGYETAPETVAKGANLYFFVDPARPKDHSKGRRTDYIAIMGLAYRPDNRRYVIEMIRDKLEGEEAISLIIKIDKYWRAQGNPIRYWWWELRGSAWDMTLWERVMKEENHHFHLLPFQDTEPKDIRIGRLMLPFERGEIVLPAIHHSIHHPQMDGGIVNMADIFRTHEFLRWRPKLGSSWRPNTHARNEDLLDALAQSESPEVQRYTEYPVDDSTDSPVDLSAWLREKRQEKLRRKKGGLVEKSPWACMWATAVLGQVAMMI